MSDAGTRDKAEILSDLANHAREVSLARGLGEISPSILLAMGVHITPEQREHITRPVIELSEYQSELLGELSLHLVREA